MSKKRIHLIKVGTSDRQIRQITQIPLVETQNCGDAINLPLRFESRIQIERFVDVDHNAFD